MADDKKHENVIPVTGIHFLPEGVEKLEGVVPDSNFDGDSLDDDKSLSRFRDQLPDWEKTPAAETVRVHNKDHEELTDLEKAAEEAAKEVGKQNDGLDPDEVAKVTSGKPAESGNKSSDSK